MKHLAERITEALTENYVFEGIEEKDWMRMADLYLNDKSGASVAKSIKDKNKAIARYVTGVKISGSDVIPEYALNSSGTLLSGQFSEFFNKAIELGATKEEIIAEYDKLGTIPEKISEKISIFAAKNMGSWVIGDVSKSVYKAGFDMTLSKGGNATTVAGKEAMDRSGRKWTIGYVATVKLADKSETSISFDAITDEGVNNNVVRYVFALGSRLKSNHVQSEFKAYSKTDFIKLLIDELHIRNTEHIKD